MTPARLRARWRARPPHHSRALWAILIVLDVLPWPWGEDVLASLFAISGLARPTRRRAALAWARANDAPHPWRLAARVCAFQGRWVARRRTLGIRRAEDLRGTLVLEGWEHVDALAGGAILLGFHVGPPGVGDLTFRVLRCPVSFVGWTDRVASLDWWSEDWRPSIEPAPLSFAAYHSERWTAVLYAARARLLKGETLHILADGFGREAFRLSLSVGELPLGRGWIALHQLTGVPVLPFFGRLEGRRHVMTIHPPLPMLASASRESLEAWRDRLTPLVEDYVRRFPEQCPHLALVLQLAGPAPRAHPPE